MLARPDSVAETTTSSSVVLVCAWCTDRWDGERWTHQRMENPIPADAIVSHGMCPDCAAVHFQPRSSGPNESPVS
jgi:hypothetical protein